MTTSEDGPHRCWAEIDLDALLHNAQVALDMGKHPIMAVVKANAYGHGAVACARALAPLTASFGLANVTEALELRAAGITRPLFILGAALPHEREIIVREGFTAGVSTLAEAGAYQRLAQDLGKTARLHLILDTGMGRCGFADGDWSDETLRALAAMPNINWAGACTHYPVPDEDAAYTREQTRRFTARLEHARRLGLDFAEIHIANSGGLLGFADACEPATITRPGLMLYGESPLPEHQQQLQPVMTLKSRVVLCRLLPAGSRISYGGTVTLARPTRVATLAIGYADGYSRHLSNRGAEVLVRGVRCPVLGRVTMDQIMVDVNGISPAPIEGEEVVLFGRQNGVLLPARELAEKAGTIPWEIFTGIGTRVIRING